jgi:hypothetical protein
VHITAKKPKAIIVSIVALSINLSSVFFYIGLFVFNKHVPNVHQLILFGLDVFALLGIFNEYRWAWVAGNFVALLNFIVIESVGALFISNKILPAIMALIEVVIPGIVLFFILQRPSVRDYFQLNCPKCGQPGNVSYFYNFSKCKNCDVVW